MPSVAELNAALAEHGITNWNGVQEFSDAVEAAGAGDLRFTEADMPMLTSFISELRAAGVTPAAIGRACAWYLRTTAEMQDGAAEQRDDADLAVRDQRIGELQELWGKEYAGNIAGLRGFLELHARGSR